MHLGAVGHVGVVAAVLDDAGRGHPVGIGEAVDRDDQVEPERRRDGDRLGPLVAFEQPARRLGRGRGAGAGGVALARPLRVPRGHGQAANELEAAVRSGRRSWRGSAPLASPGPAGR